MLLTSAAVQVSNNKDDLSESKVRAAARERRDLYPRGGAQKSERRDTCEGAGGGR